MITLLNKDIFIKRKKIPIKHGFNKQMAQGKPLKHGYTQQHEHIHCGLNHVCDLKSSCYIENTPLNRGSDTQGCAHINIDIKAHNPQSFLGPEATQVLSLTSSLSSAAALEASPGFTGLTQMM